MSEPLTDAERESFRAYAEGSTTEEDGSQCQWADYTLRLCAEVEQLKAQLKERDFFALEEHAALLAAKAQLAEVQEANRKGFYSRCDNCASAEAQLAALREAGQRLMEAVPHHELCGFGRQSDFSLGTCDCSRRILAKRWLAALSAPAQPTAEGRSKKMAEHSYAQLVDGDLAWLLAQPRTLERDHIEHIVRDSLRIYYPTPQPTATAAPSESLIADHPPGCQCFAHGPYLSPADEPTPSGEEE